jgi:hypothetical protein
VAISRYTPAKDIATNDSIAGSGVASRTKQLQRNTCLMHIYRDLERMKTNRPALFIYISLSVYALSICWFAYSFQNGLMDMGVFFNADSLYFPSVFKNIFAEGKHFSDWQLAPSLFIFPDALLYALAFILSKHVLTQIIIFALLESLLFFVLSGILLSNFLRRSDAIIYSALISSNIIVLGIYTSDPYSFSFLGGFHFGSLLSFLLLSVLFLKFVVAKTTKEKRLLVASSLFIAVCSIISDRLILLQFVAPIILIGLIFYRTGWKQNGILKFGVLLLIGFLIASILEKIFVPGLGKLEYEIGFGSLIDKSMMLVNWAINKPVLIQLCLSSLPIAIFSVLIYIKNIRNYSDPHSLQKKLLAVLLLISIALTLLVTGLSSRDFAVRYLLPYLLLPPLFLFIFLDENKSRILAAAIFCSSVLAVIATLGKEKSSLPLIPQVVQCIDEITQKHGVRRGIAQYWDAIPVYVLTSTGLNVVPVLNNGSPMRWMYNSSEFAGKFSFAIIDNGATGLYRLSRTDIEQLLSRKPFEYQCYDKTVLIFDNEAISLPRQSDVSNIRNSALESFIKNPRALLIMAREEFKIGDREAAARLLSEAIALLKQSGARADTVEYYESLQEIYQP